jgi:hypothetical protein
MREINNRNRNPSTEWPNFQIAAIRIFTTVRNRRPRVVRGYVGRGSSTVVVGSCRVFVPDDGRRSAMHGSWQQSMGSNLHWCTNARNASEKLPKVATRKIAWEVIERRSTRSACPMRITRSGRCSDFWRSQKARCGSVSKVCHDVPELVHYVWAKFVRRIFPAPSVVGNRVRDRLKSVGGIQKMRARYSPRARHPLRAQCNCLLWTPQRSTHRE